MLTTLAVENYRSLRYLVLPLGQLTVITGANGSGKSNLYRALRLLADCSRNGAVAALAREGGLPSTLWAGPDIVGRAVRAGEQPVQGTVRRGSVALRLGFAGTEYGYAVDLGFPIAVPRSKFTLDPEIKRESVWTGPILRAATVIADRHNTVLRARALDRTWFTVPHQLQPFDSMLSEYSDPDRVPELLSIRDQIRSWRFYDSFRTDAEAPARAVHIGTRTPVLGHDGSDLAAALQTIREIGQDPDLDQAITNAFPGSRIEIVDEAGRFAVRLHQHGLLRPLDVAELSDGTLRYLLWVAALLSPRPPPLLVLNEPETRLHPDLIAPLAELVCAAATKTQVVAVSHSRAFIDSVAHRAGASRVDAQTVELTKDFGRTQIVGQAPLEQPPWRWPSR